MAATPPPQLTLEQAKAALREAIAAFELPENFDKITAAAAAAPEEQRAMAVLPVVQQIQSSVLTKYGFEGPAGVFQGIMAIKMHESDPEVKEGIQKVTTGFMQHVQKVSK
mmetsp:Transcript_7865/g.21443  ORF Transcript_7865/g.21443 Transcript_7865/m.21443 type:complete len:110 (+) Transcript_7865:35-364(+)